jgi:hypothetical protein
MRKREGQGGRPQCFRSHCGLNYDSSFCLRKPDETIVYLMKE